MSHNSLRCHELPVCLGVVKRFEAAKSANSNLKTLEDYEKMMREECKKMEHPKEKRVCWYLGAAKDSATNILREVSRPLQIGVPPISICRRLKSKDAAICALRYEGNSVVEDAPAAKPNKKRVPFINWNELPKMRVKQLRKLLEQLGETCQGCVEKGDFLRKFNEVRPKYEGKTEL